MLWLAALLIFVLCGGTILLRHLRRERIHNLRETERRRSGAGAAVISALACATVLMLLHSPARACSTFCTKDDSRILVGKNYDWQVSEGLLVVNKRNIEKVAVPTPSGPPATWTSRFGSVTFNQYGREFPSGGMNEAGLVIELMWLGGSKYPDPDSRSTLDCLQWIQYQLDTAASVREVLESDTKIRIDSETPLHYIVADRSGQVATVEFLDGRLVAHTGKNLPVPALTNSTYAGSLDYVDRLRREGEAAASDNGSLNRFARIAERLREERPNGDAEAVEHAFETLSLVAQGSLTQWSIVYELDRLQIRFKTSRNGAIRRLSLADLDFGCGGPVLAVDLHEGAAGDIRPLLRPCTAEVNLDLVRTAFRKTPFLAETPDDVLRRRAEYPAAARCLD